MNCWKKEGWNDQYMTGKERMANVIKGSMLKVMFQKDLTKEGMTNTHKKFKNLS